MTKASVSASRSTRFVASACSKGWMTSALRFNTRTRFNSTKLDELWPELRTRAIVSRDESHPRQWIVQSWPSEGVPENPFPLPRRIPRRARNAAREKLDRDVGGLLVGRI